MAENPVSEACARWNISDSSRLEKRSDIQPSAGQSGAAESLSHMSLAETITHNNNNIQDGGGGWCSRTEQPVDQLFSVQAACVFILCMFALAYISKWNLSDRL